MTEQIESPFISALVFMNAPELNAALKFCQKIEEDWVITRSFVRRRPVNIHRIPPE